MTAARRIQLQPAYILHHRPFRDSSLILDIVTRDHGKIALVARGSRSAKSRLAGILRPFLPLNISWVARGDLGTLTGADTSGPPPGIQGDALLSAFYVNELLLNFLHRHDPQPEIFSLYSELISRLGSSDNMVACLRSFELELLSLLGYAVSFRHDAAAGEQLDPGQHYDYRIEHGPVPVARSEGPMIFKGALLKAIQEQAFDEPEVVRAASRLLRQLINHHLGGRKLKSRKVLMEVHRGRIPAANQRNNKSE